MDAVIENNGKMVLRGNMLMEPGTEISGQGNFCFAGNNQRLRLNGFPLTRLELLGNDSVVLEDDLTVTDSLILQGGFLILGDHDLSIDSNLNLYGGSSASYVRINGSGRLSATVGTNPMTLPIGRNPYLPIVIGNGSGVTYQVGVTDEVYENPESQSNIQSSQVVSETWDIQASEAVSDVSIQIGWDVSQETSGFDRNYCNLSYWERGVSSSWNTTSIGAASGSGPYYQSRTLSMDTNLYFFGVGGSGSALPVEYTQFDVHWIDNEFSSMLQWQTASEEQNSHFIVERSLDGIHFQKIGQVAGHGTAFYINEYAFIDNSLPMSGTDQLVLYYRLKQVDFNGDFEYSPIRILSRQRTNNNSYVAFPNPSRGDWLFLSDTDTYQIHSIDGRLVKNCPLTHKLYVADLPTGTYILTNSSGQSFRYIRR